MVKYCRNVFFFDNISEFEKLSITLVVKMKEGT